MDFLITGATGFVGRALARRLAGQRYGVAALVRDPGKAGGTLPAGSGIYCADITDRKKLAALASSVHKVDAVIHLAACLDYNAGRETLFRTNVEGTANVLELAGKLKAGKFIYISSIEAMGPAAGGEAPAGEDAPCRPVTVYGESKLEAEKLVLRAAGGPTMNAVILRLGNVYGPGSLSFVAPVFKAALSSDRAWLYLNRNSHLWHPVYIDDAVAGIILAAVTGARDIIYIISGAEPATVGRIAEAAARVLSVEPGKTGLAAHEKVYLRLREAAGRLRARLSAGGGAGVSWAYSIEKARRELGYNPLVGLEEGVRLTVEWARKEGMLPK